MQYKTNWNAVGALAAIGAALIYAVQAFYMYRTLNTMEDDLVLKVYSEVRGTESRLIQNTDAHKLFLELTDSKSTRTVKNLFYFEIYDYFNLLDALSKLYVLGKFKDESFPYLYKEAVLSADDALRKTSKEEKDSYEGITQLAKIFREQEDRQAVSLIEEDVTCCPCICVRRRKEVPPHSTGRLGRQLPDGDDLLKE